MALAATTKVAMCLRGVRLLVTTAPTLDHVADRGASTRRPAALLEATTLIFLTRLMPTPRRTTEAVDVEAAVRVVVAVVLRHVTGPVDTMDRGVARQWTDLAVVDLRWMGQAGTDHAMISGGRHETALTDGRHLWTDPVCATTVQAVGLAEATWALVLVTTLGGALRWTDLAAGDHQWTHRAHTGSRVHQTTVVLVAVAVAVAKPVDPWADTVARRWTVHVAMGLAHEATMAPAQAPAAPGMTGQAQAREATTVLAQAHEATTVPALVHEATTVPVQVLEAMMAPAQAREATTAPVQATTAPAQARETTTVPVQVRKATTVLTLAQMGLPMTSLLLRTMGRLTRASKWRGATTAGRSRCTRTTRPARCRHPLTHPSLPIQRRTAQPDERRARTGMKPTTRLFRRAGLTTQ